MISDLQIALLVLVAVLAAVDAYYTRRWLKATERELRELKQIARLHDTREHPEEME